EFKSYNDLMTTGIQTTAENIKYFRIQQNGMPAPLQVRIHTYEGFFNMVQAAAAWDKIADFSLSTNDTEVFTRFQGQTYVSGSLQLQWPKYNEGVLLRPDNYKDRWLNVDGGLKGTVQQFITLSNTDPRAIISFPSAD